MEPVSDKQGKLSLRARVGKFFDLEVTYDGHITPALLREIEKVVLVAGLLLLGALVIIFILT